MDELFASDVRAWNAHRIVMGRVLASNNVAHSSGKEEITMREDSSSLKGSDERVERV